MFTLFSTGSVWYLIWQSDLFTKLILICLLAMSILCVAIIAAKFSFFYKEKKQIQEVLEKIKRVSTFEELKISTALSNDTITKDFFEEHVREITRVPSSLSSQEYREQLDDVSYALVEQTVLKAEQYLPFLGTSAAVSPLIGLFGTIWGLIHAFINISNEKSADLVVVAPGIAEALITTLGGLVVAIPAMIFFHYLANEVRLFEHSLTQISDRLVSLIRTSARER